MRKLLTGRKRRTLVIAAVVALLAAGSAIAYYLAAGTGSTNSGPVALAPVGTLPVTVNNMGCVSNCTPLNPGDSRGFHLSIDNHNTSPVSIGQITGSVDAGSLASGCQASWFSVTPLPLNTTLGAQSTLDVPEVDVQFINAATSQNACANSSVTFTFNVGP